MKPHFVFMDPWGQRHAAYDAGYDWCEPGRDNRTREEWPYSYSPYFLWREGSREDLKKASANYHDRMMEWDFDKWKAALESAPKKRFPDWTREQVTEFLSRYYGKPVKAVALAEGCNVSSGYPYFIFWHVDASSLQEKESTA